jgi:hypothetical protein
VKTKIVLEIENCSQCPHVKYYRSDYGFGVICFKTMRHIAEDVEYMSELNDKTPPEWCPCRLENTNV